MVRTTLLSLFGFRIKPPKRDKAVKTAFAKVRTEIEKLAEHLRFFNAKLTEQEQQTKKMAKDIAELQKRVDVAALKDSIKEEIRRELRRNHRRKK